jgi:hypothetical protein
MADSTKKDANQNWLAQQDTRVFCIWTITAAFCTYFCMYAFRKPFTAGTFSDTKLGGVEYKTVLVISQVLGYAISKFIGIKVISEITRARRAVAILLLIGIAEIALVGFALVPAPWNFGFLFLNGLPLGMVFGLVLGFLEGRQLTEALAAGLCASFIVSSGVVKSVGRILIESYGISEYWMPALTGLIFVLPLCGSVWMLSKIPPPTENDVAHRTERVPLSKADRWSFFRQFSLGLTLLLGVYAALTILRSIRDDFAVEIWRDLGEKSKPIVFAQTETIVMCIVVALNAAAIFIKPNRLAFLASLSLVASGFVIVAVSMLLFELKWVGSFTFMVISGIGMYVPYVAFHTTVFERLIAASREKANLGFLMYLADSAGYLGYVGVLLDKSFRPEHQNMLSFFCNVALLVAACSAVAIGVAIVYFSHRLPKASETDER